jgi:hypothetical protein
VTSDIPAEDNGSRAHHKEKSRGRERGAGLHDFSLQQADKSRLLEVMVARQYDR